MFGKVKHEGEVITVLIIDTTYFDDKLYSVCCQSLGLIHWHRGFSPDELLSTWHDKEHPRYLQWKQNRQAPKKRIPNTTIQWNHNTDEDSKGRYWG